MLLTRMKSRSQLYRYQRTGLLRSSLSRRPSAWGFPPLPPALGMGVLSSAAGPRPRASLLCRRPSAMALFSSFRVFKFSSFRFFKFSNFHKCSPPSLPPSPPEILAETKPECKTLGRRIFSSFQIVTNVPILPSPHSPPPPPKYSQKRSWNVKL